MAIVRWICLFVSLVVFYGTICPAIRTSAWWVRVMDFPRVQFALLAGTALGALLLALPREQRGPWWVLAGCLALALVVQFIRVYPFTRLATPEVAPIAKATVGKSLRLMVSNVEYDKNTSDALLERVSEVQPSVLLLIEVDEDGLKRLAPLAERFPHAVEHPRPQGRGVALYSRFPIENDVVRHLVSDKRPSIRCRLRLPSGVHVEFYGLHPAPPGLEEEDGDRKDSGPRDAELLQVAAEVAALGTGNPAVVAGDFNDAAWSHTTREFKRQSGMLDPRVGRGRFNTYHARHLLLRYPIDHIFVSPQFRLVEIRRLAGIGADHFPMLLHVSLPDQSAGSSSD